MEIAANAQAGTNCDTASVWTFSNSVFTIRQSSGNLLVIGEPYSALPEEVLVAVQARQISDADLVFGNVRVNLNTFGVLVKDTAVNLTFFEFELLRLLCREVDRIIHYDELCHALWRSIGRKERRRLSVAICRLRVKLEASWPYRVETVRGRGYGFIAARP